MLAEILLCGTPFLLAGATYCTCRMRQEKLDRIMFEQETHIIPEISPGVELISELLNEDPNSWVCNSWVCSVKEPYEVFEHYKVGIYLSVHKLYRVGKHALTVKIRENGGYKLYECSKEELDYLLQAVKTLKRTIKKAEQDELTKLIAKRALLVGSSISEHDTYSVEGQPYKTGTGNNNDSFPSESYFKQLCKQF